MIMGKPRLWVSHDDGFLYTDGYIKDDQIWWIVNSFCNSWGRSFCIGSDGMTYFSIICWSVKVKLDLSVLINLYFYDKTVSAINSCISAIADGVPMISWFLSSRMSFLGCSIVKFETAQSRWDDISILVLKQSQIKDDRESNLRRSSSCIGGRGVFDPGLLNMIRVCWKDIMGTLRYVCVKVLFILYQKMEQR